MPTTLTDPFAPPRHLSVPDDALRDELDTLRRQRALLISYLRAQHHEGATVLRLVQVAAQLGVSL